MKPKVSERETGLLGTRLRSKPQSPGAPPRTLPLAEWPRGSYRASQYHNQGSTRPEDRLKRDGHNREQDALASSQCSRSVRDCSSRPCGPISILCSLRERNPPGLGAEGEGALCSEVCGARATGHYHGIGSPSAPNPGPQLRRDPGAGFSLGTAAKLT